jgi:hypothetical protein
MKINHLASLLARRQNKVAMKEKNIGTKIAFLGSSV